MAEAAVSFLMEQLKEVLIGYRDLIGGAENEFKQLNNDLDLLKAFLRKMVEKKKKKDKLMEVLEKRITEVVYEVEDTIDTCLTNAIEAQVKAKNSCMPGICLKMKRLTLASEVKSIREGKVQPLFEDAKKFADMQKIADGNGGVESPRTESKRDTPIRKNRVVGVEDEEKTITAYLMKKTEELDVISIVGIPGQGKTTLAWKIYEVYGDLEGCPPALRGIGEHIAIKCDGVPLTIVVIGGVLVDQLMNSPSTSIQEEWQKVAENVSEALTNDKAQVQLIKDVVKLSYDRLRDDLRDCFVYTGVFPEDYEIPAKMLCGLWIAEGYILPQNGKSLEKRAEENLNDLICRNLLKVEKTNHMGKVKTCRVHDMIRAFCLTKSNDQNLFQEIKKCMAGVSEVQNLHRLCFNSELSNFLSQNPRGPHVRSLLCFYKQPVELEPDHINLIPDSFTKLRILESKSIQFHIFPAKVTKLIHLRYLTLSVDNLTILPKTISQLWNLQALIVETKSRSIEMKANIWRMIRLKHLKTKAPIVLDSKWEGEAGQNLQTLDRLSPESCTEAVSKKAKNLKVLGISGKIANIFKGNFLESFDQLEKLRLVNSLTEDLPHGLPDRNCFPPNLKKLTLMHTSLKWPHMSTLAKIKTLESLKLKDNAFDGVKWDVGDDKFPNLQLLLLTNINLVLWEVPNDSFPKLTFLVVKNCEYLREIPECLGKHLEKLEIEHLRDAAVASARKIGDTKDKPKDRFGVQFTLKIGPSSGSK